MTPREDLPSVGCLCVGWIPALRPMALFVESVPDSESSRMPGCAACLLDVVGTRPRVFAPGAFWGSVWRVTLFRSNWFGSDYCAPFAPGAVRQDAAGGWRRSI